MSIGQNYFSYFFKYVIFNYRKVPLKDSNHCYSLPGMQCQL